MSKEEFNAQAAHRYFSATCFNSTWDLIDNTDRSDEENQKMLLSCYASLYHWTNREDANDQNFSIGYWQLSRVHALMNNPQAAFENATRCLSYSHNLEPFYLGYAYEAQARAKKIAQELESFQIILKKAWAQHALIEDKELAQMLGKDLQSLA
jgi:hypothetical protein